MRRYGLILAGGQGERLRHVRKADLRIGGIRLIERVAARFSALETPILVSIAQEQHLALDGAIPLPDALPTRSGPMAGIYAALDYLGEEVDEQSVLIVAAVDTPFLPENYVARLTEPLAAGHTAAFARWNGTDYPTNAAFRIAEVRNHLRALPMDSRPNGPKSLLAALGAAPVEWSDSSGENPFANCNTLEELIFLGRRARDAAK